MRKKDELAIEKILECAKKEFEKKGFLGASMRAIAINSGYTTGMLYGRFCDKSELFKEIVSDSAEKLYNYYANAQDEFASFEPEKKYFQMHIYVDKKVNDMLDIVYDNLDIFKLIICKSKGSEYEHYVERLIDLETKSAIRFVDDLNKSGLKVNPVRKDFSHMLATAMFNGMFEVIAHDFSKEEAVNYVKQLQYFFNAGWEKILGLPSEWEIKKYNNRS